jgi:colanic acid/amylovoran biosynthesis glycosyltransferase
VTDKPDSTPLLLMLPSVPAWRIHGRIWLDRKFCDGVVAMRSQWAGRIKIAMSVLELAEIPPFGAVEWDAATDDFELTLSDPFDPVAAVAASGATVVMASADDHRQLGVAAACRAAGVPCIYVIEYTLRTRVGMAIYNGQPWHRRLRTLVWLMGNERRMKRAMRLAASIQANGLPAFRAYPSAHAAGHLFFDTRLPEGQVIPEAVLEARLARAAGTAPIRLAFSGRLIAGKGADALVPLALALRARKTAFRLHIYGSGELGDGIRQAIAAHELQDEVIFHGPVDFDRVLMPALAEGVDLFVCCHRQGDPSCTYAETLGCGVPIVGFDNEALESLVRAFDIGWTTPMGDVQRLAARIGEVASRRADLARKSRLAREFALKHNFESAFRGRALHCTYVASHALPDHS